MAILSNGKFYGFLCSAKATGRKLSNGVKEYVEDFVSGFAGHGWKLWEYIKGKWKLEIDSLVVRETMVVFELLIQKIRAVKGALGITQACGRIKTATLDESGQNWLVTIEDEMSFVAHDFIRCQDWTNGTLKGYWVEISEIRKIDGVDTIVIPVSEFTGGIGYIDGMEAVDPVLSGMTTPAVSDEIVQFGNSENVNRQSAIYLHADEGGQPAIDILFGINSKSFAGCTKIRMGGDIPGTDGLKGFYCENGMIKGTDSTGHVVYCIYPDGTAEFGDGSARFATDRSGHIAGGAISWYWDALKNKYVCSMKGVVLTWDNLDEETKENLKGEGSIYADLDDEMQSVACSLDGTVISGLPITTTFSMSYGTTKLTLDSLTVGSVIGVTSSANKTTGVITVSAITAASSDTIRIPVTGKASYKDVQYERTVYLSVNKIKPGVNGENAVIYSLQPSVNAIKRDSDGNSDVPVISCRVLRTDGASTVVSSLPYNYWLAYIIDNGNEISYKPDKDISVSDIKNVILFRMFVEDIDTHTVTMVDRETIYVVQDGTDGHSPYISGNDTWMVWDADRGQYVDSGDPVKGDDGHSPIIQNGTWWVWDAEQGNYVDTGIKAKGEDGHSPYISGNDTWMVWDAERGQYVDSGDPAKGDDGHSPLILLGTWWVWDAELGKYVDTGIKAKGEDGRYTELRYKYSFGKPATPTGINPAGWSLSLDREDITFSYSGDFTRDGDYYVSPSPTSHSSLYKQRVTFTTRRANQIIHIEIDVSSEQNYDKGIVEALDTSYHMDNTHAWVGSGVANAVVDIVVPTAGSHFVDIVYTKDGSGSNNEDRVKFRMLDPTTCWYSTAVIDGETTPSWSEPVIFPTDSKTEEQVYLLAKSNLIIDIPASNEYVNEYIGDAPEYSSTKSYSVGNVVKYNNIYKVAIKAGIGNAPTNATYWEDVLWWVDNPRGASETYPYEYICERTLQDGKWGSYKNYHLFGHYGKDGEPGEDGKDANLLPWVEQWDNNKTLIDGEYVVSPKMFSGTKDSDGRLTGIALGRDCITIDGEKRTGIFALVKDEVVFELDPINQQYIFKGRIEADSGKIGEWNITSTGLAIAGQSNANIYLNINGGKFLRINPTEALMYVRNDEGNGIWVTTYGGGDALKVLSNGSGSKYGYAIDSAGNHRFFQRDGDIWNAPGVLWAAYVRGSDGYVMRSWGNGCTTGYIGRSAAGNYVINHNLGNDYFPFAIAVHGTWSIASLSDIASGSFHVRTFHKDSNYGDSDFFVAIMGRNRD